MSYKGFLILVQKSGTKYFLSFFIGIFLFACHSRKDVLIDPSVPVICLDPDEAGTWKMSDFFDDYRVLTFKGMACKRVHDFIELGNKIVATPEVEEFVCTLCVFDSVGNFLYQIGELGRGPGEYLHISEKICLGPNSSLLAMDVIGIKSYDLSGQMLWENKFTKPSYETIGFPKWMLNDSIIIYKTGFMIGRKYSKDDYFVQVVKRENRKVKSSFFPADRVTNYVVNDNLYVYGDSVCYYSDIDQCIYQVTEDAIIPRYRIDKGVYDALAAADKSENLPNQTKIILLNENNKYVLGEYNVKKGHYCFIYDKIFAQTYNFKNVEDDLLLLGHLGFPKNIRLYNCWQSGMRQSDEYMYFYFSPSEYVNMIDKVKKALSKTEWEEYQTKHPDLMKIYREIDDDSNPVVIGYKFK